MYSTIMADEGFNVENECLSYNLSFTIHQEKREHTKWFHLNLLQQKIANMCI